MQIKLHRSIGVKGDFPTDTWLTAKEEEGFMWVISCKTKTNIKRVARSNIKEIKNENNSDR